MGVFDRRQDSGLNTSIDDNFANDLNLDDPFGGGGATFGGDSDSPVKTNNVFITEAFHGMAEGLSATIGEDIERNMPNVATVFSEIKDTYEDIQTLKDEISRQIAPMMVSMENVTRKILPRVEKLMPKKWYDKAKTALEDRAAARAGGTSYSEAAAREKSMTDELDAMFAGGGGSAVGGQSLEAMKHTEFESKKAKLIDRAISSTQHKLNARVLNNIYAASRSTELFHRTIHTAYLKKSLELKYKHLFVAQDTFNLLARSASAFEGYFKGIVQNTSLPDAAKMAGSKYEQGTRTRKYGSLISDFLTNARKNIIKKISGSIKDALGNLDFAASGLEMGAESLDQADEMAEMGVGGGTKGMAARGLGWLVGRLASTGPSRAIFEKLSPYLKFINGEGYDAKERAYLGISKLRDNWASSGNWLKEAIADILPSISTASAASNDLLVGSDTPVPFDKMVRQSIVEIIPAYLSKILHSTDSIKAGLGAAGIADRTAMDATEEQAFNLYRRRMTTTSQLERDIYNDPMMFGGTENQTTAVTKALGAITAGIKRKSPEVDIKRLAKQIESSVSTIIANHGRYSPHFEPKNIVEFVSSPDVYWDDPYIKKISKGLSRKDFYNAAKAIRDAIVDDKGIVNDQIVSHFKSAIIAAMRSSDGYKTRAPTVVESFGYRWVIANRNAVTDAAGNIIQKAKKGLINDDNSFNNDMLDENVRKHDAKAVEDSVEFSARQTMRHLDDTAEVYEKIRAVKDHFAGKEYVKSASKMFSKLKSKTDYNPSSLFKKFRTLYKDPKREQFDWTYLRERFGIDNPKSKEQWDAAYDRMREAAKAYEKAKKEGKSESEARATASTDIKQEAVAAATSATSSKPIALLGYDPTVTPSHPVETTVEAKTASKSITDRIKDTLTSVKNKAVKLYDNLPTTEEEVEAAMDKAGDKIREAYNNRPKSLEEVKTQLQELRKTAEKKYPNQVKAIDEMIAAADKKLKVVTESKAAKAATATAKVVKKKASAKIKELSETETVKDATTAAKRTGKKVYIKSVRASRNLSKAYEEYAGEDATLADKLIAALKTAKGVAQPAIDWSAKTASDIKDKISGTKDRPSVDTASSVDEEVKACRDAELMDFLKSWREEVDNAHRGLLEDTYTITQQLDKNLVAIGAGGYTESDAKDPSVKKKRKYGLFGKGGAAVASGFRGLGKLGWKATKKLGSFYGKALGAYGTLLKGGAKAIVGAGRFLSSTTGLNPYLDVYVKGRENEGPILTWRKQAWGDGVVFVDTKERVKATKDIDRPVMDPKTGNILITEEDIKAGLWSPGMFSGAFRIATGAMKGYFGVASTAYKGAFAVAKIVAGGLFGVGGEKEEKYVDVWRKDEVRKGNKPILTRLKQKRNPGVVFKNGERLERSSDINEPVYDPVTGEELVSQDDIDHGLVNVHNRPLGSGGKTRKGLINIITEGGFNIGGAIAKGIFGETGMKLVGLFGSGLISIWKGMFGTIFKAGEGVLSGIGKFGARLFGFDTPGGYGKKAFKGVTDRLDTIINILKTWPRGGGSGGSAGSAAGVGKVDKDKPGFKTTAENAEEIEDSRNFYKHTDHRPGSAEGEGEGEDGDSYGFLDMMRDMAIMDVGLAAGKALFGKGALKRWRRAGRAADKLGRKKGYGWFRRQGLKLRQRVRGVRNRFRTAFRGTNTAKAIGKWRGGAGSSAASRAAAKASALNKAKGIRGFLKGKKGKLAILGALGYGGYKLFSGGSNGDEEPSQEEIKNYFGSTEVNGVQYAYDKDTGEILRDADGHRILANDIGVKEKTFTEDALETGSSVAGWTALLTSPWAPKGKEGGRITRFGKWLGNGIKSGTGKLFGKLGNTSVGSKVASGLGKAKSVVGNAVSKGKNFLGNLWNNHKTKEKVAKKTAEVAAKVAPKLVSTAGTSALGKFATKGLRVAGKAATPVMAAIDAGLAAYNADETMAKTAEQIGLGPQKTTVWDRFKHGVGGALDSLNVVKWVGGDDVAGFTDMASLMSMKREDGSSAFWSRDKNGMSWWGEWTGSNKKILEDQQKQHESDMDFLKKNAKKNFDAFKQKWASEGDKTLTKIGPNNGRLSNKKLTPNIVTDMFRHFVSVELKAKNSAIEMHRTHYPNVLKDKALWTKFVEWLRTKCVSEASAATEKKPDGASEASAAGKVSSTGVPPKEASAEHDSNDAKSAAKAVTATAATAGGAAAAGKVGKAATDSKSLPKRKRGKAFDENELIEMFIEEVTPEVAKNMSYTQFSNEVKDFARENKSRHMLDNDEIDNLDMYTMMHYAPLHGLPKTGKFTVGMGELINPKTGKPVKRDSAVVDKYMDAKQDKFDDAWIARMASGKFSGGEIDKLFEAYVKSVGGISAVAKMDKSKFVEGCAKYVADNEDDPLGEGGDLSRWKHIASKLHDKLTGKTSPASAAKVSSASIKKKDVAPTSSDKPTTQQEVNDAKSAAKSAQQASQIGPTVEAAKREEARAAREDKLLSTLESYTSVFGQFSRIIGKDGLQVAGIDTLTAVTAAKPVGGGTQIINNNTVVREANEGLDLRKKQW